MMANAAQAEVQPIFSKGYRSWFLTLLVAIYACSFIDRIILSTIGQAIKVDLKLSDLQFGLLGGMAFALFYSTFGIPVARLAEKANRVTIISVCIAIWSLMTALSGVAQNYWQLVFFRMGVGLGEGGCSPAAHSLISDHYEPKKRASALAIYSIGVPLGSMLGAVAGGWVTETFSWRMAFFVVGVPGLVLALLARLTLKEPPRGYAEGTTAPAVAPPLTAVIRRLLATPTFVHVAAGCVLTNLASNGINVFAPSYLVRSFHMSFTEVGLLYGLVIGGSGTLGILIGGLGADLAARRDGRWYVWAPAIGVILCLPMFLIAFTRGGAYSTAAFIFVGSLLMSIYFAPTFAVIQNLVDSRMRASAAALILLLMNIFGQGLGPSVMGGVSDFIAAGLFKLGDYASLCPGGMAAKGAAPELMAACSHASSTGLQRSILITCGFFAWGALHYVLAAKHIRKDMAKAALTQTAPAA